MAWALGRRETEHQRAEDTLQMLSRRLLEAQESERRAIARELHDELGQALQALKINLQTVQRFPKESAQRIEESIAIVDHALQQVRTLSVDLRPSLLDDLGLVVALEWYVDRQAQRVGFVGHCVANPPDLRVDPTVEIVCFRVVQEARPILRDMRKPQRSGSIYNAESRRYSFSSVMMGLGLMSLRHESE